MIELRTDYVNAELDQEINDRTSYQEIVHPDGTKSFQDVSAYKVTGDTFGAEDMNATNREVNSLERLDTLTLPYSQWSANVPYTQTVPLERIRKTDSPIISMGLPTELSGTAYKMLQKAYGCIDRATTQDGSITFYCYIKKPATDIIVNVKGV